MRLISFLGVENYAETTYSMPDLQPHRTRFVSHALAAWYKPASIHVFATKEADEKHRNSLTSCLTTDELPNPDYIQVPRGGSPAELMDLFGELVESIRSAVDEVLIDITNGLRMHPFFAAACIQYVQAVLPTPPKMRVVYAEFRRDETQSPIWELTPFLEVLSWSRNLMMFLRTGQADEVVAPTIALGRELKKKWLDDRSNPQPGLENLGKALKAFGDDFTTIRTGSLLIGKQPSAQRLWDAIERTRDEVAQQLPALAMVLDQVRAMVEPLRTGGTRFSSADGQRVLLELARLYQRMGRYSEAISVLREGWCTLGAPENCDKPGTDDFDDEERKKWDGKWAYRNGHADPTTEVRNDIQHAGFRKKPNKADWFKQRLDELLLEWENTIGSPTDIHPE